MKPEEKILIVREKLLSMYVERERVIDSVLASLLSGEPAVLVGPPGTAKTGIIESLSRLVRARYFYYLLTRFTEPDEILGPIDIEALRRGVYKRIVRGRLPDSEIVFLDEVFKASSAIRNVLLDIIMYRRVMVGGEYVRIPMLTLYTACNEVSRDSEDAGFYDRLTIRVFHEFVSMNSWRQLIEVGVKLLNLDSNGLEPIMDSSEVKMLQGKAYRLALEASGDKSLVNKYLEVLSELQSKGVVLTDRRKVKTLLVAAGFSVLFNEDRVTPDSLADAILVVAPSSREDVQVVEEVLTRAGLHSYVYNLRRLQTIAAELRNLRERLESMPCPANARALEKTLSVAKALVDRARGSIRLKPYVGDVVREIEESEKALEKRSVL